ncbi:hypothetical protein [Nostoc sp. UIC 10630]|uniref:hypothetical protein n=1 Tax=Nostoc sp. UIC 10630 TaxID=2100146 RepID=UPI0013D2ECC7|nr:hypothetical protein [Nostoc sp. UIC 10630]NEU80706.1 hypothetical protein [Nostoc sp. UIC 10630]
MLPEVGSTLDEEGFEVADINEDEEGFAVEEGMQLDIQGYLESIENNVYIAKISKATEGKRKGFWQIDAKTIQLFKVADKPVDKVVENNSKGNGKAKNKAKPKVETVTTQETIEQLELPTN